MTWDEHRQRFEALREERGGLTVREYAEAHNLNTNTARRELKKKTGSSAPTARKGDQKKHDQKSDQPGDHSAKTKAKNGAKKSVKTAGSPANKGLGKTRAGTADPRDTQNDHDRRSDKMITSPAPNGVDDSQLYHVRIARGGRRFPAGNEDCIIHGRYAFPRDEDFEETLSEMEDPDFFETLDARLMAKTYAHLKLIERARNKSLDRLQEEAEEYDDEEDGTHPHHKELQMLLNASAGIGETAKSIAFMRTNMLKTRRDEEAHDIKVNVLNIIAIAYEKQRELNWSYGDTAAYIEQCGGKVPTYLMQQARIEAMKPPEIEDVVSTVPPEQLDAEAQKYRDMRAGKELFVEERRALVAQIVDKNNYGDLDQDGDGREGEFLGNDFEDGDDEFDLEATADLYMDDDV